MSKILEWARNTLRPKRQQDEHNPSRESKPAQPTVLSRDQHTISRRDISNNALKVMYRLQEAGFQAFLVGGGVRDLLLGGHPKDFDIATDATPEQTYKLFRNSRIIGRRFRIVHVLFGREVIEVTTFRGDHADQEKSTNKNVSSTSESGMLLRDNVYGTLEEDARRRDLTINALYYTTRDFSLHDYHQGLNDLENRIIRIIGDAETRFREDPVRMLRVVRFAAKLDFDIHPQTAEPIDRLADLLNDIPPARMFDEVLKLFLSGKAVKTFEQLRAHGIFQHLFPATEQAFAHDPLAIKLVTQALANTDLRISQEKSITPAFLYAALMWPGLQQHVQSLLARGTPPMEALHEASAITIHEQSGFTTIPKRFQIPMREIWDLQNRLPKNNGKRAERLLTHPRFRAAYDFLALRAQAGEPLGKLVDWWEEYQMREESQQLILEAKKNTPERQAGTARKRRYKPKPGGNRNR
jgi:poly(A) polymerase